MIKKMRSPDNVLALRFEGKLTADDIDVYRAPLQEALKKHDRIGLLCDLTGFSDIDAGALVKGIKADLEFMPHIGRLARFAYMSDKEWPRAVFDFMAPLLPTIAIKFFAPDRSEQAMQWVAQHLEKREAEKPAIRIIPTTKEDVFAFEINGVLSAETLPGIIDEVNGFLNSHERVRMLNRIKHLGGFDPSIFMQSGLLSMKLAAMQKVERYAIVGAPEWVQKVIVTVNPIFPDIDMRPFPADRETEAWTWIGAEPSVKGL